jgi:Lon protease-like protein
MPSGWFAGSMITLPMFPLGSVLFPAMPLALRVFEERYLKMMGHVLDQEHSRFGVVLIERGSEVGGGDKRFDVGTTAEVLQVEAPDGPLAVVARGGQRFRVIRWLEEDPYPQAEVEFLEDIDPFVRDPEQLPALETLVRETLAYLQSENLQVVWPSDIELAVDPVERAWQLAGISPLGPLDHQDLLECESVTHLVQATHSTVREAVETFRFGREN